MTFASIFYLFFVYTVFIIF